MKSKVILLVMLVALIAVFPMMNARAGFAGAQGPIIDVLRQKVVRSPDAALAQMLAHECDISPDQIRTPDIVTQKGVGMLATQDLGFHMGFIAYNIRDTATINTIRTTYRGLSAVSYWPLHDVEFREALIRSYNQLAIIPPVYGFVVTPVRSLVPPAQSKYYNAAVPAHPFNQGDPFTSPVTEKSTCGILKAAGYTFVDAGTTGVVDDADYWKMPNGDPVPYMEIWTPLQGDAPTSWQHGQMFVADLATVGLASTTNNGNHGFVSFGRDFGEYLDDVYGTDSAPGGQFDAFMVFYGLGRLPDQLYDLLHTSQDSYWSGFPSGPWGLANSPGVNDPDVDDLCETVKYSLDPDEIEVAAEEIQAMLYTPDLPNADNFALAYMLLYSRAYTNVFTNDLLGAVRSPGYGSDNGWTYLNLRWASGSPYERLEDVDEDGDMESIVVYINGLPPDSLNPCYATTAYEWNIINPQLDGLTAVNPYNHYDMPWIAEDWDITEVGGGMEVDFTLRDDVYWADGYLFDAYAVEFNWEFFRDWATPNFHDAAAVLTDVVVTDATHCTIIATEAGLPLFYDYAGGGAVLPPQIWDRAWGTSANVLNYHPENHAYGSDMAPGYAVGPWAEPADPDPKVATNLFGTGAWIFQFYDETNDWDDNYANRNYFMSKAEMQSLLTSMFWEVGDADTDGEVDGDDEYIVSVSIGYRVGETGYDARADFDSNGFVGIYDFAIVEFYLGWQREYP